MNYKILIFALIYIASHMHAAEMTTWQLKIFEKTREQEARAIQNLLLDEYEYRKRNLDTQLRFLETLSRNDYEALAALQPTKGFLHVLKTHEARLVNFFNLIIDNKTEDVLLKFVSHSRSHFYEPILQAFALQIKKIILEALATQNFEKILEIARLGIFNATANKDAHIIFVTIARRALNKTLTRKFLDVYDEQVIALCKLLIQSKQTDQMLEFLSGPFGDFPHYLIKAFQSCHALSSLQTLREELLEKSSLRQAPLAPKRINEDWWGQRLDQSSQTNHRLLKALHYSPVELFVESGEPPSRDLLATLGAWESPLTSENVFTNSPRAKSEELAAWRICRALRALDYACISNQLNGIINVQEYGMFILYKLLRRALRRHNTQFVVHVLKTIPKNIRFFLEHMIAEFMVNHDETILVFLFLQGIRPLSIEYVATHPDLRVKIRYGRLSFKSNELAIHYDNTWCFSSDDSLQLLRLSQLFCFGKNNELHNYLQNPQEFCDQHLVEGLRFPGSISTLTTLANTLGKIIHSPFRNAPDRTHATPLNKRNAFNQTVLIWASLANDKAMVSSLLGKGAHIDARDVFKRTALLYAARYAGPEVIQLLLNANASITAPDCDGKTALDHAQDLSNTSNIALIFLGLLRKVALRRQARQELPEPSDAYVLNNQTYTSLQHALIEGNTQSHFNY